MERTFEPAGRAWGELYALREAAFGGRCERDPLPLLGADRRQECVWLAAVVLGGHGRYAAAAALLSALGGTRDPVFRSLAASTLASQRRQLGGHALARGLDGAALRAVAGLRTDTASGPVAAARHDALLGLAADAVGLGRPGAAAALLTRAGDGPTGSRQRVRSGWVRAEHALSVGDGEAAAAAARHALAAAEALGSFRHLVKSRMVLAAAFATVGTESSRAQARGLAAAALDASLERGLVSLVWPSALLLRDLGQQQVGDCDHHIRTALTCIYRASDPVGRRLLSASPWAPPSFVRSGDGRTANG